MIDLHYWDKKQKFDWKSGGFSLINDASFSVTSTEPINFISRLKQTLDLTWLKLATSEPQQKNGNSETESLMSRFFAVVIHISYVLLNNSSSGFTYGYVSNFKNYKTIAIPEKTAMKYISYVDIFLICQICFYKLAMLMVINNLKI